MNKSAKISSFLLIFVFIFNLLLYESDTYTSIDSSPPEEDEVNIGLVVQPVTPYFLQFQACNDSGDHNDLSTKAVSANRSNSRKNRLAFDDCQPATITINNSSPLPILMIISILQKCNHWHQSPDDDTFLHV